MNVRALAILLTLLSVVLTDNAHAESRVALVLGNGDYRNVEPRINAVGDAHAIADLLKSVGFDVIEASNVSRLQLGEHLGAFADKADAADIAIFYYAGQGLSLNGMDYVLPVDASIKSEMDIKLGAGLALGDVLEQAMGHARVKVVLFDAPRQTPYRRTGGTVLAQLSAGEGTLMVFSTGPGQASEEGPKGGHSPFTQALLENLAVPGAELQAAVVAVRAKVIELTDKRQLPWGHTNLTGAIYLNPASAK
jgi:uncharacterized caspase-like protein